MADTEVSRWLQVWETCAGQPSALAALHLLRAACPEAEAASLAALSPGRRDALLLDLREALFGGSLACTSNCPACAERLELGFHLADLRAAPAGHAPAELQLAHAGFAVRFRLPTALDIARVASAADMARARTALIEACVVDARLGEAPITPSDLPEELVTRVAQALAEADPQAAPTVALSCPACGHAWEAGFDIAAFLARELDAWARRLLLDVHLLAQRYGWTETDVFALSPARRRAYLDLADA